MSFLTTRSDRTPPTFLNDDERGEGGRAPRQQSGRRVLLCCTDHGCLWPADLRGAAGAARARAFPFDVPRGRTGRLPAVQTVPTERADARRTACLGGGDGVPCDREHRKYAEPRCPRQRRRQESLSFSSRLQDHDRRYAKSVCGRSPRAVGAGRIVAERHGDGCHLRRRVQFLGVCMRRLPRYWA